MVTRSAYPDDIRSVRRARSSFLSGEDVDGVRPVIITSWRRSRMLGADPTRFEPPYQPDFDEDSPLLRAAQPVMDRLIAQVSDMGIALFLSDRGGRIVARRTDDHTVMRLLDRVEAAEGFVFAEDSAGTNGLGTALETGNAVEVVGAEHFTDRLVDLTCVGVPIVHPVSRQIAGVIDMTCHVARTSALIRPLVEQASRDIAELLYEEHTAIDRALMRLFLESAHGTTHGVVAVNDRLVISNARASRLMASVDQGLLWEAARRALTTTTVGEVRLESTGGPAIRARVTPVGDDGAPTGAVLEIRPAPSPAGEGTALPATLPPLPGLAGSCAAWRRCCARAWDGFRRRRSLLLTGENGVGRLALATALHESVRAGAPLVVLDAAGICAGAGPVWPSTIRRTAAEPQAAPDGTAGTLVVRNLQLLDQPALERLRSVARGLGRSGWGFVGTAPPSGALTAGAFGPGAVVVELPPLRERLADLPALVCALADRNARDDGCRREISAEVVQVFGRYSWPGNIAQLARLIEGWTATPGLGPVRVIDLPEELLHLAARRPLSRFEHAEIHAIVTALAETGGNKKDAAVLLGISRSRLYRKLHSVGIDLEATTF